MQEQPDIRFNQGPNRENNPPEIDKKGGFSNIKIPFPILAIVMALLILGSAVFFFSSKSSLTLEEARLMQSKMIDLEQKIAVIEKQIEELNAKMPMAGSESEVALRIKELGQRLESLEKRSQPVAAKVKPAVSKPAASPSKQYYTVHKGDTLLAVSKKYKISLKELRKLNHLSEKQGIRPGQKLLVSPG
jgi:LysM repeat protein